MNDCSGGRVVRESASDSVGQWLECRSDPTWNPYIGDLVAKLSLLALGIERIVLKQVGPMSVNSDWVSFKKHTYDLCLTHNLQRYCIAPPLKGLSMLNSDVKLAKLQLQLL